MNRFTFRIKSVIISLLISHLALFAWPEPSIPPVNIDLATHTLEVKQAWANPEIGSLGILNVPHQHDYHCHHPHSAPGMGTIAPSGLQDGDNDVNLEFALPPASTKKSQYPEPNLGEAVAHNFVVSAEELPKKSFAMSANVSPMPQAAPLDHLMGQTLRGQSAAFARTDLGASVESLSPSISTESMLLNDASRNDKEKLKGIVGLQQEASPYYTRKQAESHENSLEVGYDCEPIKEGVKRPSGLVLESKTQKLRCKAHMSPGNNRSDTCPGSPQSIRGAQVALDDSKDGHEASENYLGGKKSKKALPSASRKKFVFPTITIDRYARVVGKKKRPKYVCDGIDMKVALMLEEVRNAQSLGDSQVQPQFLERIDEYPAAIYHPSGFGSRNISTQRSYIMIFNGGRLINTKEITDGLKFFFHELLWVHYNLLSSLDFPSWTQAFRQDRDLVCSWLLDGVLKPERFLPAIGYVPHSPSNDKLKFGQIQGLVVKFLSTAAVTFEKIIVKAQKYQYEVAMRDVEGVKMAIQLLGAYYLSQNPCKWRKLFRSEEEFLDMLSKICVCRNSKHGWDRTQPYNISERLKEISMLPWKESS